MFLLLLRFFFSNLLPTSQDYSVHKLQRKKKLFEHLRFGDQNQSIMLVLTSQVVC